VGLTLVHLGLQPGQSEQMGSHSSDSMWGGMMKTPALFELTGRLAVVTVAMAELVRSIALGLAEAELPLQFLGETTRRTRSLYSWL
jgi:hypothetical protein